MAEPSIELNAQDEMVTPTYDLALITAGTVDTTRDLRWGGPNSSDGSIEAVTKEASGDKWAEELWIDDSDGVDYELLNSTYDPDAATQANMTFELTTDDVAFAAAPIITCYDDTGHGATPSDECLVGSAGHVSTFVKITGNIDNSAPVQYWGEASSAALHLLEDAGAVTISTTASIDVQQGLNGDVAWLVCSATNLNTVPQYFMLALSVPDDATTGTDAVDIVLSLKYQYT